MKSYLFAFILALGIIKTLSAQTPSVFNPCARILTGLSQDSITWQAQPCANFNYYIVFGRRGGVGNFTQLAVLASPSSLAYVNNNNGEALWEYQIEMYCGGSSAAMSIIFDNQRPVTPDLRNVSIVNNLPVVSWNPSVSPEVIGYYLYKENPYGSGNYFPYPSANFLITNTQYTDATATDLLARYAIVAVSPCNKGLLGEGGIDGTTGPHTSIRLTGSLDSCNQTISLSWNAYERWRDGVLRYEIWVSQNNQGFVLHDTTFQTNYTYNNAQDLDSLDFYIRAVERNQPSNGAITNVYSLRVLANRPMDFIYLNNITVNPNNEVEISWLWDNDVDFVSANLNANNQSINSPALSSNQFIDVINNPNEGSYAYQLSSVDACGFEVQSEIGYNLQLTATAEDNYINKLIWPAFNLPYATVLNYEVYKSCNSQFVKIATFDSSEYAILDPVDIGDPQQYNCCYYLVANSVLNLPNGRRLSIASRSNTACATQEAVVHLPNAFAPQGENRFFKPVFVFKNSIRDYKMLIYDRYGKLIFETNNYNDAWRGEGYGQGVYTYLIQFTQNNGQTVQKAGTVMLIR